MRPFKKDRRFRAALEAISEKRVPVPGGMALSVSANIARAALKGNPVPPIKQASSLNKKAHVRVSQFERDFLI